MIKELPKFLFALREDLKDEKQFLPARAEPLASGWDCRAAMIDRKTLIVRPGQYVRVALGFRAFCPEGWWYRLMPRSSSFVKKSMHALYGVVDEAYNMEALFCFQYIPDVGSLGNDLQIEFGDPIAQIIPVRRQEMIVEEITDVKLEEMYRKRNAIRSGGFGSTG
jgi:dUTPase